MVRGAVLDLQEGQGRASETTRQDAAVGYPAVEMGGYYDGFYHQASQDRAGSGFDLGHRRSIDQERPLYPDSGEHLGREIGRYLYQGGGGTARGASVGDFRQRCAVHFQVLEEIPRRVGYSSAFQHRLSPVDGWPERVDHPDSGGHAAGMCFRLWR